MPSACFNRYVYFTVIIVSLPQIVHAFTRVVESKFMSLKFEVLAHHNKDRYIQVPLLLFSIFQVRVYRLMPFSVECKNQAMIIGREKLSVKQLSSKFGGLLPQRAANGFYHNFVSYRLSVSMRYAASSAEGMETLTLNLLAVMSTQCRRSLLVMKALAFQSSSTTIASYQRLLFRFQL